MVECLLKSVLRSSGTGVKKRILVPNNMHTESFHHCLTKISPVALNTPLIQNYFPKFITQQFILHDFQTISTLLGNEKIPVTSLNNCVATAIANLHYE